MRNAMLISLRVSAVTTPARDPRRARVNVLLLNLALDRQLGRPAAPSGAHGG